MPFVHSPCALCGNKQVANRSSTSILQPPGRQLVVCSRLFLSCIHSCPPGPSSLGVCVANWPSSSAASRWLSGHVLLSRLITGCSAPSCKMATVKDSSGSGRRAHTPGETSANTQAQPRTHTECPPSSLQFSPSPTLHLYPSTQRHHVLASQHLAPQCLPALVLHARVLTCSTCSLISVLLCTRLPSTPTAS